MSTSNLHLKINELITGYNLAHSENLIDIEDFLKNLEKIGGVNSELMEYLEEKDITDLAPNMPKLLVRAILTKLKTSVQDQQKNQPKGLRPEVMAWLENYDPTFPDTNAANLRVISRNQPCIVFTDDKKVDVATSAKLLEDIINGYPASNQYIIEGSNPRVVYCVGVFPWDVKQLDPLTGTPLRSDETSPVTGLSWADIPKDIRKFFYIAKFTTQETGAMSDYEITRIAQTCSNAGSVSELAIRFPRTFLLFNQLKAEERLPTLLSFHSNDTSSNSTYSVLEKNTNMYGREFILDRLYRCTDIQIQKIVFLCRMPRSERPGDSASLSEKIIAFVNWAESFNGCGLQMVAIELDRL